jgi:hypothetical protein
MTVFCNSCHKPQLDFKALALHISSEKKGHRKGKLWAAKFLTKVRELDRKVTNQNRPEKVTLTEEQKEAKRNTIRQISGKFKTVLCVCPECKKGHTENIEIEYIESNASWVSPTGHPMVLCGGCK